MDPASPAPVLETRALSFSRNDEPVFGPLDLTLHGGEVVLVEGDNGSGKTTLLRILAGILRAGGGAARLYDAPLRRDNAAGEVLYLGHQLGLKGDLSVLENLRYATGLYGRRPQLGAATAVEAVGLAGYDDALVRQLSAGQKKRVALARLLLLPARIWLLDEPWANLDRHGIALVNRLVERHVDGGGSVLATSHGTVDYYAGRARRVALAG